MDERLDKMENSIKQMSEYIKQVNLAMFSKAEMLPKTFSDHNPVSLVDKRISTSFRWKLKRSYYKNSRRLQVESFYKQLK